METIREFMHANRKVKVYTDDDPPHPRKDWDNLTTIAHWHRRYDFGTKIEHIGTEEEVRAYLTERGEEVLAILPLYLFDHSGLKLNNEGFGCRFDSGQVGWIYITRENAEKMGCIGEGWDTAKYENAIRSDTETYSQFVSGEVYGFKVFGRDGDELADGWGYFGDIEECAKCAQAAAEESEDPAVEADAEELASRVTYAGVMQ